MNPETLRVLARAGWKPDSRLSSRKLNTWYDRLAGFTLHGAAVEALVKFGGLRVNIDGPGESMSRQAFELDPTLAWGEENLFLYEGNRLGKPLYPLGEGEYGRYFLAIANDGYVYALCDERVELVGATIEEAIANLVQGIRGSRLF